MCCTFTCKIKTRGEMDADQPKKSQGWWYDICPGQTLELRHATVDDLKRVALKSSWSRNPNDYMCETSFRGALILKSAIKYVRVSVQQFNQLKLAG